MKKQTILKVLASLSCAATLFTAASCSCSNPNTSSSSNSEPSSANSSESSSQSSQSQSSQSQSSQEQSSSSSSEIKNFAENVAFKNQEVTYDGTAKSLTIENLPAGATVTYSTEKEFVNAGTYEVKATITCDGYNPKELTGSLTINKANYNLSSYKLSDASVTYDGTEKGITPTGTLPEGVTATIKYYSDAACTTEATPIDAGTYYALVSFTHSSSNHNTIDSIKNK